MSVLIKGMEMPKSCRACRFARFGGRRCELNVCMFTGESQPTLSPEYMSRCPLVPVPAHGRLIDADALDVIGYCGIPQGREDTFDDGVMWLAEQIDLLHTIIPADESNMDSFIHIFEEDDEEDGMDSFIRILKD